MNKIFNYNQYKAFKLNENVDISFTANGGNKVVDKNGNPLVLYHATENVIDAPDFLEFDINKLGSSTNAASAKEGFFFTKDIENAKKYLDNSMGIIKFNMPEKKHTFSEIIEHNIHIKNKGQKTIDSIKELIKISDIDRKKISAISNDIIFLQNELNNITKKWQADYENGAVYNKNDYKQHEKKINAINVKYKKFVSEFNEITKNLDKDVLPLCNLNKNELQKIIDKYSNIFHNNATKGTGIYSVNLKMSNPLIINQKKF